MIFSCENEDYIYVKEMELDFFFFFFAKLMELEFLSSIFLNLYPALDSFLLMILADFENAYILQNYLRYFMYGFQMLIVCWQGFI